MSCEPAAVYGMQAITKSGAVLGVEARVQEISEGISGGKVKAPPDPHMASSCSRRFARGQPRSAPILLFGNHASAVS